VVSSCTAAFERKTGPKKKFKIERPLTQQSGIKIINCEGHFYLGLNVQTSILLCLKLEVKEEREISVDELIMLLHYNENTFKSIDTFILLQSSS
jgi:hypothetical protein